MFLELQMTLDANKRAVLRTAAVVGMTTTGMAPSVACTRCRLGSCQQLILIGDHQQLRPKTQVLFLAQWACCL